LEASVRATLGLRLGPGHDTGAALVYEAEGELRCVAVAEERLSREKHSRAFPINAIRACLDEAGIQPSHLDSVVFEKTVWEYGPTWIDRVPGADWEWFTDDEERAFFDSLGGVPCFSINHHLAHAASAWHTTQWPLDGQPGAVLVVDGRGSTWGDGTGHANAVNHYFEKQDDCADVSDGGKPLALSRFTHAADTQSPFVARGRTPGRVDPSPVSSPPPHAPAIRSG